LLVVDEAQSLPIESLEELRMLSNFQAGGYPLLQIFLLGQPEFRIRLQDRRLEQLRQRVIAMHHLGPMDADEVEPYLIHRLSCVGWRGKPRFTNDAIAAMYQWSGGTPRRLNQLASRVLLFGAIEQIDSFTADDLYAVITDLDDDTPRSACASDGEPFELRDVAPMPIGSPSPPSPGEPWPIADAPAAAPTGGDPALTRRIAELETHIKDQDEALRRVLTLLVDWVEGDGRRPDLSAIRGNAA
jgi:general secretion pathway protein A